MIHWRQVPCVDGWCVEVVPLNGLIEHLRAQHCGKRVTASADGLVRQTWFLSLEKWDKGPSINDIHNIFGFFYPLALIQIRPHLELIYSTRFTQPLSITTPAYA